MCDINLSHRRAKSYAIFLSIQFEENVQIQLQLLAFCECFSSTDATILR